MNRSPLLSHALSIVIATCLAVAVVRAMDTDADDEQTVSGPVVHQPSQTRPYSAAVQAGDTYWLAGKIGVSRETAEMEEGRVTAETHNIMGAFESLLSDLGMDFGNVVRGVVYLTDMGDYAEMNEAYGSYFEPGKGPSRVTLAVADLVGGATIEISFIAVKD